MFMMLAVLDTDNYNRTGWQRLKGNYKLAGKKPWMSVVLCKTSMSTKRSHGSMKADKDNNI